MAEPDHQDDSIGALIARLVEDARNFVRAEVALYRTQLFRRVTEAKLGVLFGASALGLANAALIALLVGLESILAVRVGPAWATMIVVMAALAVAGVLGWLAMGSFRRMMRKEE